MTDVLKECVATLKAARRFLLRDHVMVPSDDDIFAEIDAILSKLEPGDKKAEPPACTCHLGMAGIHVREPSVRANHYRNCPYRKWLETEPGDKNSFNALGGGWQSIETAPTGYKLLVKYHNSIGKARYVLACYYEANTLESEETESGFAAEGWYEESETHDVILPIDRPPEKWMHIPRDDGAQPHLPSDRASEIMGEADCEAYDEKVQEVLESINAFNAAHPEHLKFSAQIWAMIRHLAAFRTLHRMGRGDASEIRPNDPPTDDDLFFGHVSAIQSAWQRLNEFQAGSRGPYTGLPTDLAVVLRALKRTPEKPKDNLVPQSQENAVGEESTLAAAFRAGWFARNNHRDNDIQSADLQYAKQKRSLKQSLKP